MLAVSMLALFLIPGMALAAPIPIVNFSFEDDRPPSGGTTPWVDYGWGYFNTSMSGWTIQGGTGDGNGIGTWIPNVPGQYFDSLPNDTNIAYVINGNISQTLSTNLASNNVYTLTVYVGDRKGTDREFDSYAVQLYAGNNLLAEANSLKPSSQWLLETVTYPSTDSSPGLGAALTIKLVGIGAEGVEQFEKVFLDVTPVPLPTALIMLGSGLLGMAAYRRRKLSKS